MGQITFKRFAVNAGAILAISATMAGMAYAAAPKNSVTSKSIKDRTLQGRDVKLNALTGNEINEASLKGVVKEKQVKPVYARLSGGQDIELISNGTISVRAKCDSALVGGDALYIYGKTSVNGAYIMAEYGNSSGVTLDTTTLPTNSDSWLADSLTTPTQGTFKADFGYDETGFIVDSTSTKTIDLMEGTAVRMINRGGTRCFFSGTFNLTGA